jgi:predicted 3-demethylubiquinone-9 3-methyltransferase (glyoxalase superfamily)
MSVTFELDGLQFIALNGPPMFQFSPAISFFVKCTAQQEVDELWEKLSAGGEKQRCGWLKDKYGVSWQIIPTVLGELLQDKDAAEIQARHAGHDADGQDRHRRAPAGCRIAGRRTCLASS